MGPGEMGARRRPQVLLWIFFTFFYPALQFPLPTPDTMGDMSGSTFRTSHAMARARRTDGPVLSLIHGTGGRSHPTAGDALPSHARASHPGHVGFTPDGVPSDVRVTTVHHSEPVSPNSDGLSPRPATADFGGEAATGSGPIDGRP